jgi:glucosamine-6-phosphate deaminase
MQVVQCGDAERAGERVAAEIAELARERLAAGGKLVLGLATGETQLPVYRELARLHREGRLSLAHAVTFNLDEFLDLEPGDPRSFAQWMQRELFRHVDVPPRNIHLPVVATGVAKAATPQQACAAFEQAICDAGGIDLQLLGIGRNGHIGFNEPGSSRACRTRRVELHPLTREDEAPAFGGLERVPTEALTMGVATILEARRLRVLAFGARKAAVVRRLLEGPAGPECPVSFVKEHPDALLLLDRAAASV